MPNITRLIRFYSRFALMFLAMLLITLLISNSNFIKTAHAQERVYTYTSIIKVLPDRSLDVTETITVYVENKKIRHGIFRDFDTIRVNQDNEKINVDLKIIDVKRNGVKEKYHTQKKGTKIRVFFGSKRKIVNKGIQTYIFHYITNNQLNAYSNDRDGFYWNASGNKWSMPIFRVEAIIILPLRVKQKNVSFNAYSGYNGVNKQDYASSFTNNHTLKFALNRKYLAGNGLTISIAWPAGLIDAASASKKNTPQKSNESEKLNVQSTNSNSITTFLKSFTYSPTEIKKQEKHDTVVIPNEIKKESSENIKNTIVVSSAATETTTSLDTTTEKVEPEQKLLRPKPLLNNIKDAVTQLEIKNTSNEQQTNDPVLSKSNTINEPKINNTSFKFLSNFFSLLKENSSKLNISNVIALISLFSLLGYFLVVRLFLNKNTLTSENRPNNEYESIPDNLSPASIRYISETGYDDRTFSIALINIAVKGHIDIINTGKSYKIERRDFSAAEALSTDEELLLTTLMENNHVINLTSNNHEVIRDAMTKHKDLLEKDNKNKYFSTNFKLFKITIALIISSIIAITYFENESMVDAVIAFAFMCLFTIVTYIVSYALLSIFNFYNNFKISYISNSMFYASLKQSKEAYIFALIAIQIGAILFLINYTDFINVISLAGIGFICALLSDSLNSPNTKGKILLNKIVNLKEFITHGEILQSNAQYDSIQISQKISAFDNYLPYTIALGLESEWGDHYSLLFDNKNNGDDDILGYSPHWYHGTGWKENNTTGFCKSLSSNFSLSASSAANSPDYNLHSDDDLHGKFKH